MPAVFLPHRAHRQRGGQCGAATINGLVLNLTSKPRKAPHALGGLTLLDTNCDDFKAYGAPGGMQYLAGNPKYNAAAGSLDASGNQIVNASNVSLNLAAQKDFDLASGSSFYVRDEYHTRRESSSIRAGE
jgi:hypothetical protein